MSDAMAREAPDVCATRGQFVHAGALVVRERGLLIRGASGSGKSSLAQALVREAERRSWFARIVADDTVGLTRLGGRLVARAHPRTAGLAERRGTGIVAIPHEPACVLHLVVDLVEPADLGRLPEPAETAVVLAGVSLPRRTLPRGASIYDNVYLLFESIVAFEPS